MDEAKKDEGIIITIEPLVPPAPRHISCLMAALASDMSMTKRETQRECSVLYQRALTIYQFAQDAERERERAEGRE